MLPDAMIAFAVKCARSPQALSPADHSELRWFGLKEPEIVEIIGMAALAAYANIIADATAMQNDDMFEQI
jgi:alkylhydroperoxidase family enzyme